MATFWAILKYVTFKQKTAYIILTVTALKFGLLLIPASGHTGLGLKSFNRNLIQLHCNEDDIYSARVNATVGIVVAASLNLGSRKLARLRTK